VTNGWIALALTPLTALGSIAGPALQGIMSRTAADNQQGELQGTITSINAVATIVAPLLVTQTFWYFTAPDHTIYLPGAPFLLSALLTVGCIVVFMQTPRPKRARVT
jgi:DHA1 family tetracycline resistance protein-like MFS transporter